jgi:hypothetical protein
MLSLEDIMSKLNRERKRLHELYHRFYDRHYTENRYECFYCSTPADTLDHVPPLSWIEAYGLENLRRARTPLSLVPACGECNSLLGNKKLLYTDDRLRFLETKYHSLFEKLARWTDDEIAEMGPSFQQSLKVPRYRELELMDKIRGIERRLVKSESWPDFHYFDIPEN